MGDPEQSNDVPDDASDDAREEHLQHPVVVLRESGWMPWWIFCPYCWTRAWLSYWLAPIEE